MTVESDSRPPERVCNVSECNAWRTGDLEFCHHHKGMASNGTPEKGNQRAQKHGLYSTPEYLKQHFSETQEDRYIAYFEALCSRYERRLGHEPDAFAKDRLSRVAIECVKERIADEWLSEQAEETGNLLVESHIIGVDDEGRPISVEQENQILSELAALRRETRMTLKDMGLLNSPEDKAVEASRELGEVVKEALEPQD